MPNFIDLTNQRYGRLIVLERIPNKNGRTAWRCKCDCGNIIEATGKNLRNGHRKSCGCLDKENKNKFIQQYGQRLDITGKIFGVLKAQYFVYNKEGRSYWNCKCIVCGKEKMVEVNHLTSGHTNLCECQNSSRGELIIQQLLDTYHIPYQREYYVASIPGRFDFYVDQTYMIEFDGIQHFQANGGWNTEQQLQITKQRDNRKNNWCIRNNIPIIRIPYIQINNLNINDLLLDTSTFLLKHSEEANDIE